MPKISNLRRDGVTIKGIYGITIDEYFEMLTTQNHTCKICKKEPLKTKETNQRLVIDHDHSTNRVRGLLCNRCNNLLGWCSDQIELLQKCINYLENS